MKALGLLKRWGKSRGNRRKQRGGWRGSAGSGLQIEPLEQRRMLSVSAGLLDDLYEEGDSSPSEFVEAGGTTFFVAEDPLAGRELWKTDGTTGGTELVKDIYPSGYSYDDYDNGTQIVVYVPYSSDPQDLIAVNGKVYFTADHGEFGRELWVSDGTAGGTQMVVDLYEGEHSDGTPTASDPQDLTSVDGGLVFTATNGVNGRTIWLSNGTEQGTIQLADGATGSDPASLTLFDEALYFTADDGDDGTELWKTDGSGGVVQVEDINPGADGSDPDRLTVVNETLYFTANNGDDGTELWRTDGSGGVEQVDDINPGPDGSDPDQLTVVNGTLYFTANNGDDGTELWKTDGSGGVEQVDDINPGAGGSNPTWLTNVDGTLYFAADDGTTGTELWKTGSAIRVEDINPESGSSNPSNLVNMNGTLYFSADDGVHGSEVWVSDGTGDGTFLLADIYAGGDGSDPTALANVNGTLFFSADDGAVGQEPWTFAPSQLAIYINGQRETIPAQIGVDSDGNVSEIYTLDDSGTLLVSGVGDDPAPETVTLGDFFNTWQNNAGNAENRGDAVFNSEQILNKHVDDDHRIQVFVNGIANQDFEDYAIQGGDEIAIIYTEHEVVSLNTNVGSILMALYREDTPLTYANFLNYVNDGDYIDSFFHRSDDYDAIDQDFVIQAGGFTTDQLTLKASGDLSQFDRMDTDPAVLNEPGLSNVRGTVAMARGQGVNSATSQFYVNMVDNGTTYPYFLDTQNEGFTVFGHVLNMDLADAIAAFDVKNVNESPYPFNEVPLTDDGELIVFQSIGGEGEVHGTVFDDRNGDGVQDTGEAGRKGVTLFIDENNNGLRDEGEFSTTSDDSGGYRFHYKAGQHVLRQELSGHRHQTSAENGYSISVQIGRETAGGNFGSLEVLPLTGVDLADATDSGIATDGSTFHDDLTNFNNSTDELALQFNVTGGTTDAHILVYAGDLLIGSASAASQVTVTTDGVTLLEDGTYEITARQMLFGIKSAPSDPLEIEIDTVAPADFETVAPVTVPSGGDYEYDAYSPDEGTEGTTILLVGAPGDMDVTEDGVVTWAPTAAEQGVHEFEIRITDDAGNYSSESVVLTVLGDLPAHPDYYVVDEDGELSPTAGGEVLPGLLDNDGEDETGLEGTATLISGPSHGELVAFGADGSFTYVPEDDFSGTDMFIYMVTTASGATNEAPVTITVAPVNDPPKAVADSYVVAKGGFLEVTLDNGLLSNDSDVDSAQMIVSVGDWVEHGSLNIELDGTFTYEPDDDYSGIDTFTYRAVDDDDSHAESQEVTVTITVNAPPKVIDSEHDVLEDAELVVTADSGVLAGATDAEGDDLTAVEVDGPGHGTLTLSADGSFTYEPDDDFFGTDSFTFRASDGMNQSDVATVTINVLARGVISGYVYCDSNDNGIREDGEAGVPGAKITLTDVTDPDNHVEKFTWTSSDGSYSFDGLASGTYEIEERQPAALKDGQDTIGTGGGETGDDHFSKIALSANGESVNNNFGEMGLVPSFIRLNMFFASTSSLEEYLREVLARAVNDAPTATADDYETVENGVLEINATTGVLHNDVDVDGSPASALTSLAITELNYSPPAATTGESATYDNEDFEFIELKNVGPATIDLNGVEFTEGVTFAFTGSDVTELASGDTVLVVNDVSAFEARYGAGWNVAGEFDGTLNDDGERVRLEDSLGSAIHDFLYDDEGGWPTEAGGDGETLQVVDVRGDYNNAANWIASVASPGTASNTAAAVDHLMAALLADGPDHGDLILGDDGSFTYTPDEDYFGFDDFTYRASDGTSLSEEKTVTIEITP